MLRVGSRSSRLSLAISAVEAGRAPSIHDDRSEHIQEIDEIKRYEDFTTIDWVQDAAREQVRRQARRQAAYGAATYHTGTQLGSWRDKITEAYDAGQAWIVVTLIGMAIGLNAAFLNIATEWLSDIKLGAAGNGAPALPVGWGPAALPLGGTGGLPFGTGFCFAASLLLL